MPSDRDRMLREQAAAQRGELDADYAESARRLEEAYADAMDDLDPYMRDATFAMVGAGARETAGAVLSKWEGVVDVRTPGVYFRGRSGLYGPHVNVMGVRTVPAQVTLPRVHPRYKRKDVAPGLAVGVPSARVRGLDIHPREGRQYKKADVINLPVPARIRGPRVNVRGPRFYTRGYVPRTKPLKVTVHVERAPQVAIRSAGGLPLDLLIAGRRIATSREMKNLRELRALKRAFEEDMAYFQRVLRSEMVGLSDRALGVASRGALNSLLANYGAVDVADLRGIGIAWRDIDPRAVRRIIDYTSNPELRRRMGYYAEEGGALIDSLIIMGVTRGWGPMRTAHMISKYIGSVPFSAALRQVATAQMYAYRGATREIFQANSVSNGGVIKGWIWWAQLDNTTCGSCVVMHGTEHTVDEILNDHHRGRCVMLPKTLTYAEIGITGVSEPSWEIEDGETWFRRQPGSDQMKILGRQVWTSWRQGGVRLSDLTSTYEDPVFGTMRRQATMSEIKRRRRRST